MRRKALLAGVVLSAWLGCKSSDTPARSAADAATPRDAAATGEAGPQDGAGPPAEAGPEPSDAASAHDAAGPEEDASVPPTIVATYVYQGGWDFGSASYPFRTYSLNRETGALTQIGDPVDLGPNPSYVTPSADGRFLYVANESDSGGVTVASIGSNGAPSSLGLSQVVAGSSGDNYMVFSALDRNGKHLLAASYNGPSVSVFERAANGSLGGAVETERFAEGQAHSVRVHPSNKWAFVPLKDADAIAQFAYDGMSGSLTANAQALKASADGAGPRHIAFNPKGTFAYVSNEHHSTVSAYRVNDQGQLEDIETESSLPSGFADSNTGAHVLVHPSGKYLYASNRGHDSIAVFTIAQDGSLTLLEHEATRGQTPRNFDIDARGELMVVANQDSGSLAVFRIADDGTLAPLGDLVTGLPQPNAVAIVNVSAP